MLEQQERVGGQPAGDPVLGEGALQISDGQGSTVRLFVDEKTGMPVKVEYASPALNGPRKRLYIPSISN